MTSRVCPRCLGQGSVVGFWDGRKKGQFVGGVSKHDCLLCEGTGSVTPHTRQLYNEGVRKRRSRIERGLSLNEEAAIGHQRD